MRLFFTARGTEADRIEIRGFAMAAAVLGVKLLPRPFLDRKSAAGNTTKRQLIWFLEASSEDKKHETAQLWKAWRSEAWRAEHPDEPITLLRAYWDALQEAERREPDYAELQFSRGNRFLTVPAAWPKERILTSLKRL